MALARLVSGSAQHCSRSDTFTHTVPAVARARQYDRYNETIYDNHRCGASTIVAGAVMAGRSTVESLLSSMKNRGVPRQSERLFDFVLREYGRDGELSTQSVQFLQDTVQDTYCQDDGHRGTDDVEFSRMIKAAGFAVRWVGDLSLRKIVETLMNNQMIGLSYRHTNGGHVVLLGRDSAGELYISDSARRGWSFIMRRDSPALFDSYLTRKHARPKGNVVFSTPKTPQPRIGARVGC